MTRKTLTFLDHLEELRKRIIIVVLFFVVIFSVCLFQSQNIINWIKPSLSLIFIHPVEVIYVRLKIAFYFAAVICYPVLLYQIFRFLQPAILKPGKWIFFFMLSSFLFIATFLIYRYLFFPYILKFLLKFSLPGVNPYITISNYISVFFVFFLIFALLSQLPLMLIAGVYLGIIKLEFLKKRRKEIYVLSFILSALLTPPDVLSQILLAIPLILLLELSILISAIWIYNDKNEEVKKWY